MELSRIKCCDDGESDDDGKEAPPISRWMKTRNGRTEAKEEKMKERKCKRKIVMKLKEMTAWEGKETE